MSPVCLERWDPEGLNWTIDGLEVCFSIINHPSIRQVRFHRFDSAGGASPDPKFAGEILGKRRTTSLQKLSLFCCDIDVNGVAELMRTAMPLEFELVYDRGQNEYSMETCINISANEYIEAIRANGQSTLERLTYYRDFGASNGQLPFDAFERLKYLRTDMRSLFGNTSGMGQHSEEDLNQVYPAELSLPPQLEVLEILYAIRSESRPEVVTTTVLNFLEKRIVAYKQNRDSNLRELRFADFWSERPSSTEIQELQDLGTRCGLAVSISHLPEDWLG